MKILAIKYSLLLMPFFGVFQTNAQTQTGLRLGVNTSTVKGGDVQEVFKAGYGYNAGIFVRIPLSDVVLQTELIASSRNYTFSQRLLTVANSAASITEKKIKATYLDIPVLIFIDIAKNLDLVVGPQASINVSNNQEVTSGDPLGSGFAFRWYEVSLTGGLSYRLPSGLDLTLRGVYGLTPIFDKTNPAIGGNSKPDISTFQLQFTVGLPVSSASAGDEPDRSSYKTIY